ncbi:hypothetical protein WA158_007409 [Blastocystis sp. Blastoise]
MDINEFKSLLLEELSNNMKSSSKKHNAKQTYKSLCYDYPIIDIIGIKELSRILNMMYSESTLSVEEDNFFEFTMSSEFLNGLNYLMFKDQMNESLRDSLFELASVVYFIVPHYILNKKDKEYTHTMFSTYLLKDNNDNQNGFDEDDQKIFKFIQGININICSGIKYLYIKKYNLLNYIQSTIKLLASKERFFPVGIHDLWPQYLYILRDIGIYNKDAIPDICLYIEDLLKGEQDIHGDYRYDLYPNLIYILNFWMQNEDVFKYITQNPTRFISLTDVILSRGYSSISETINNYVQHQNDKDNKDISMSLHIPVSSICWEHVTRFLLNLTLNNISAYKYMNRVPGYKDMMTSSSLFSLYPSLYIPNSILFSINTKDPLYTNGFSSFSNYMESLEPFDHHNLEECILLLESFSSLNSIYSTKEPLYKEQLQELFCTSKTNINCMYSTISKELESLPKDINEEEVCQKKDKKNYYYTLHKLQKIITILKNTISLLMCGQKKQD